MKRVIIILAAVTVTAAIARAQAIPDVPIPPDVPDAGSGEPKPDPVPPLTPRNTEVPTTPSDPYPSPPAPKPKQKRVSTSAYCQWEARGTECMPEVLTTPTGWLLPGAMLYSRTGLDTGGGVSSDSRVGLGDVAEFGVATTDSVRARDSSADLRATRIQPYVTASFRLGIDEGRLFDAQPGMTLGFRKSFERNHDNFKTKVAELTLVASKHFGKNVAIHIGGAFWDASLEGDFLDDDVEGRSEVTLHGFNDTKKQVRPFGGIELRPLPSSQILVDLGWAPEFCYQCSNFGDQANGAKFGATKIRLRPILSWGVRTQLAKWMRVEAGVRVPDIGEANLLDAQIFGQVSFTSGALRTAVESLQ